MFNFHVDLWYFKNASELPLVNMDLISSALPASLVFDNKTSVLFVLSINIVQPSIRVVNIDMNLKVQKTLKRAVLT